MSDPTDARDRPAGARRWLAPAVEYGPLAVFFLSYLRWGLMPATAALMAATLLALGASLVVLRRLPWMPLITAAVVGIFGGLTLWLEDDRFIKMKPTIVQGFIALLLFGGLALRRSLLKPLLGAAWPMDEEGWRRLSLRFACFFAAMAVLNELVWRTQSTDVWVFFKVFGLVGLTLVFALAQVPLMSRHGLAKDPAERGSDG